MPKHATLFTQISQCRSLLRLNIALGVTALLTLEAYAQNATQPANAVQMRTVEILTDEGTGFKVARSPADGSLLLDLQGVLWTVPANGGEARRITHDFLEAKQPSFSPDGRQIVTQSYADGFWHIWLMNVDGSGLRQLTTGPYSDTQPRWSPDGARLVFVSDRGGSSNLWSLDLVSGALSQLTQLGGTLSDPTWSADGKQLAFVHNGGATLLDLASKETKTLVTGSFGAAVSGPALSPDGQFVAYVTSGPQIGRLNVTDLAGNSHVVGEFDDVYPLAPLWLSNDELMYGANGKIRVTQVASGSSRVVPFQARLQLQRATYPRKIYDFDTTAPQPVKGIAAPALSPDGKQVVFQALNDLWLLSEGNPQPRRLTEDAFYESDPAWSPDGEQILYATDASGRTQLHLLDLASGNSRQLSNEPGAAIAPAWSRDGKHISFQTETYETRILDLASGESRKLADRTDNPSKPSWSADGKTIVMTAINSGRNRILMTDVASGEQRWYDPAPYRSVSTRGDDGPIWSPDGRWLLFSMESTLWLLPVAANGEPSGAARRLTTEVSDAPSWSGDSRQVLYLHNGELKKIDISTLATRVLTLELSWQQHVAQGRKLVHAGRLWDGVNAELQQEVDILIVNNRIADIFPHRDHAEHGDIELIDATNLTVTPGLFEAHNHQQMRAKFLGDRQGRMWLAYGITSTRSTGDPVYRGLEDREALAAGARIGPRLFNTGEMLDGSRLLWAFSRPVESEQQLQLELERIKALDYDVIKTYMNFRSDWQARVADWAHREMGISVTSHFIFPGIAHGVDGAEHFVGPTRWGGGFFPHLFSGNVYEDLFASIAQSGIQVTSTNFAGRASLPDMQGLLQDPRLRAFYPPWEYNSLKTFHDCAAQTGPCNFFLAPSEEASHLTAVDLKRIKDNGGTIMVGSDAPLDSYVISTFQNMLSLAQNGFSAFEALQAAAIIPARAQGVDKDLGSIEQGKLADLVLVEGNPAEDIRDIMKVRAVMKAGEHYSVEELLEPFAAP